MLDFVKPIDYSKQRRIRYIITAMAMAVLLSGWLYYEYKNYPEEHQVTKFFESLERKDYQTAYQIWQPLKSYTFKDFSQDWGPDGIQGPVTRFNITGSTERGSGVIVRIRINGKDSVSLWVEKKDKSLSFPP